ncbi:hypothetical protein JTB14_015367 [Gonioctena quinquepunctata]|nr:hypothetical protein JTB14_015367 [Gonioctena quinquepunctata]
MHHEDKIDESTGDENKPEMITLYNLTIAGVDCVDQLMASYDVSRNTRRWPMTIFYSLPNISAINSFIIYRTINKNMVITKTGRRKYLKELGMSLVTEQLKRRSIDKHISRDVRLKAAKFSGQSSVEQAEPPEGTYRRCAFCRNRKTRFFCHICRKMICMEHSKHTCPDCARN